MTVRVRFAPSPTGLLHIGNIRSALFNYLFARKEGGHFLLRLDDTDQERSTVAFAQAIEEDLTWLGITWDEYVKQSDRFDRYNEVLEDLKKRGFVYPCFETQQELDLKRTTQRARGLPPVYDRAALKLSQEEREQFAASGRKPHWRFKLNHSDIEWDDCVQGHKRFPSSSLSDPVLVREDGVPLYTYCSVVDDVDFSISHIIRGEDHVTNTAVQIQIWRAISSKPLPLFAHFPLIVSADGKEMSKRLGTLSIRSMREEIELEASAITSLLGALGTSEPIMPHSRLTEVVQRFDIHKISRATPKFDQDELKSLNAKILHSLSYEDVRERLVVIGLPLVTEDFWNAIRPNLTHFKDVQLWWRVAHGPIVPRVNEQEFLISAALLLPEKPWDHSTWFEWTKKVTAGTGRKGKELFMPLRLALTGTDHGPEMKLLLPMIGYDRAQRLLAGEPA